MAQLKDLIVNGDSRIIGNNYNNSPKLAYGTCATAAATAEKVVVIEDPTWNLQVGDIVGIRFTYTNSAGTVKLNVNNSGAIQVACNTSRPYTGTSSRYTGTAGRTAFYQYDGTYWYWISDSVDGNDKTYTSAYCGTAAATAAKIASMFYYGLTANSYIFINFRYANTYAGAITLNIDNKGAYPIYINGEASSSTNYNLLAGPYLCYFDGTNYYFRTDGKLPGIIEKAESDGDGNNIVETYATINAVEDAQMTADKKKTVFLETQPVPPYDVGDIWFNNKKIYVCVLSRGINDSFSSQDFTAATDYIDNAQVVADQEEISTMQSQITQLLSDSNEYRLAIAADETLISGLSNSLQDLSDCIRTENSNIVLGENNSLYKIKVEDDKIGVYYNGQLISNWQQDQFTTSQLNLGNFAFIPRQNGSLGFRKVK